MTRTNLRICNPCLSRYTRPREKELINRPFLNRPFVSKLKVPSSPVDGFRVVHEFVLLAKMEDFS